MKKINTLNGAQAFQVAKWLEENFATALTKTRPAVALMATEVLGFTVTEANILAAESTIGKSLTRTRRAGKPPTDTARFMARELMRLQEQLGLTPHPGLVAIANR